MKQAGLTKTDIKSIVNVYSIGAYEQTKKSHEIEITRFESGTFDNRYDITAGDDLIIHYLDLDRQPMTYTPKGYRKPKPFIRVRFQFPELHKNKKGKPMKYSSPYGSGLHLYLPEAIIKAYETSKQFDTLYVQEGELKSEVSCKNGMMSVGIGGKDMIASNKTLPRQFELIIKQCGIKNVVFMLDGDLFDLASNLKEDPTIKANQRPNGFFTATRNFKDYFKAFANHGIFLELYLGWVLKNKAGAKGIDDLIMGPLKKEKHLAEGEARSFLNDKHFTGKWIHLQKITTESDSSLKKLWHLTDAVEFAAHYQDQLKELGRFKFWNTYFAIDDDGKCVLAQKLTEDEKYWNFEIKFDKKGRETKVPVFDFTGLYNFIYSRNIGRVKEPGTKDDNKYYFIHIVDQVARKIVPYQIKDFVIRFTEEMGEKAVLEMLYRGGDRYLGNTAISTCKFIEPNFLKSGRDHQYLFFKGYFWKIDSHKVLEKTMIELAGQIWKNQISKFDAEWLKEPMIRVEKKNDKYYIGPSKHASDCHFFLFINQTSKFAWREEKEKGEMSPENRYEWHLHVLNKMTAFGYLLHNYKNPSFIKAVVLMDGKMSEVGTSNGRTGKSLFGKALEQIIPCVRVDGKNKKLTEDAFLYEEVSLETELIFIDDVRKNLDFESFYPAISGQLSINRKFVGKQTLNEDDAPKFLITTNHAINMENDSDYDRLSMVVFSDWYSAKRKPVDDFGQMFFKEWDHTQWNLFYNFCATCLHLYFQELERTGGKSGIIEAPMQRVEQRALRQKIGEDVIAWADLYFNNKSVINKRIDKKIIISDFIQENPRAKNYMTPRKFKKAIKSYCEFREFKFNPQVEASKINPNRDDKSGGREYYTIANQHFDPNNTVFLLGEPEQTIMFKN